jgi:hypothetical protein
LRVAGPGLVELVAEGCERVGAPWRGEGVEADEQFTVAGDDVAGGEQGFADQGVCLVAWTGVVAVQGGGQGGFASCTFASSASASSRAGIASSRSICQARRIAATASCTETSAVPDCSPS